MSDQLQLIAAFLTQYLEASEDGLAIPPDARYIKAGLRMLVKDEVMTVEEIRQEALEDFNVVIPWELFEEE